MFPDQDIPVHALSVPLSLSRLGSTAEGLTQAEAEVRLGLHGPNRLHVVRGPGPLQRFLRQFSNVLVVVLIGAAVVTAALGHWIDTGVIIAVVLANAAIGFLQEGKAEAAMAAIRRLLVPQALVLRDGRTVRLAGEELVPGDVVLLAAGDKVPADLRLIEAHGLAAQEAALTGESVPVEKDTRPAAQEAPLGDRHSMLWSGTLITQGTARGLVVATGSATELGRIGGLLAGVADMTTPLITQVNRFGRWLSGMILLVALLALGWGLMVGSLPFPELLMAVVGMSVAAIPEGLPAVMTITLATGAQAMARRQAIVRRLPAIEAIGAVAVICTDKTGTLTRNEMVVTRIETPAGSHSVEGQGYAPEGRIDPPGELAALARAAVRCNDATLRRQADDWLVDGDPMEGALLAFAGKVPGDHRGRRLDLVPFDSRHRFMAVLSEGGNGPELHVKGAPEKVLAMCSGIDRQHWHERASALAAKGLRVLALAEGRASRLDRSRPPEGLRFLGLIGLIDPPRPEAVAAVAECKAAGIAVKVITGDHAGTAKAIARQIGFTRTDRVLTGADLDRLDDIALTREVLVTDVFARTSPEDKLRLVKAFQANGLSVAMTGDGVNDAPALKQADVGVAMGLKGSEAAKEAADLVLGDDNFATIAAAVREGRTVNDNLRKVIGFELPTSAGEALVVILALSLGLALPITAVQILWINLITGITLGLALAFEPTEPWTMRRPARPRDTPILSGGLLWHVVLVSVLFIAAVFAIFSHAVARGVPLAHAQTLAMNMLVVLEIFHLLFIRTMHASVLSWASLRGNRVIWTVVTIVVLAQLSVTYMPALQPLLGTQALPLRDWLLILAVGMLFFLVLEVEKRLRLRFLVATAHEFT